jgi:CPA2 family monovalent cation:H+ antiporter-2
MNQDHKNNENTMLNIIVTTLLITLVINILLKKIHLPTIIGYIFTGTIIAYAFDLHNAINNHDLKEIAEFGIVFLMFTIGLEFSIEHLKKMRYEVFIAGSLQIVLTALIVYLIAYYLFDIRTKTSIIIALAVALSSTAIVLKTFNETGEINKRYGRRSLGILIMQDIAVIPILLIISFMTDHHENIALVLTHIAISATVLLLLLWLFGKYLLEPFLTQIIETRANELFVGTILFLAIGASYLAHVLGFSYSLGAFIAGMLIAETKYKHEAEEELVPFRDLLLGVFFITVGMQIQFDIIFAYLHIIILLLIAVMVLKFVIIFAIIRINENKRTSLKTALSLVQIGEFSLAILELARHNDLIVPVYGQIMIMVIVLSMIITPFILNHLTDLADKLIGDCKTPEQNFGSILPTNHTVILGFGEFGHSIAKTLKENNEFYLAVENNIDKYHQGHNEGEPVIFGNATNKSILNHLNIKDAKSVIVAIDNPKKRYYVCNIISKCIDYNKIIVRVHTISEKQHIQELGINNIIVENEETSQAALQMIS